MQLDELDRRLKRIMAKVETAKPTTAEDVHFAALVWAVDTHPDEAAAGHATGADMQLAAVARANPRDGDASAQTVCDAAQAWRAATRLDRGPEPDPFRRLLARVVGAHQPTWWHRNRVRVALVSAFTAGFGVAADGVMDIENWGPTWLRLVLLGLALVCMVTFTVVMVHVDRAFRR